MRFDKANELLQKILNEIDLPDSAYERAKVRYENIGEWLHRPESGIATFVPQVSSSGSFRLGLANKPVSGKDAYDLDMVCKLTEGISCDTHTQKQLKSLLEIELESYRAMNGIAKPLAEKRRCWTMEYSDQMSFHMDIVPAIPESQLRIQSLQDSMRFNSRLEGFLASEIAALAISITDNKENYYDAIVDHWPSSNPEGYAKWFESRMRTATAFLENRQRFLDASIDTVPYYRWKTPLQQAIQILKQHRDVMFEDNPDSKPISIIITTLSARAYQGEGDLASALQRLLDDMDKYINQAAPYVPNPVNPKEDFADKWFSVDHAHHRLPQNFDLWLRQARAHFKTFLEADNPKRIIDVADSGLDIRFNERDIAMMLGVGTIATQSPQIALASGPKPWSKLKK